MWRVVLGVAVALLFYGWTLTNNFDTEAGIWWVFWLGVFAVVGSIGMALQDRPLMRVCGIASAALLATVAGRLLLFSDEIWPVVNWSLFAALAWMVAALAVAPREGGAVPAVALLATAGCYIIFAIWPGVIWLIISELLAGVAVPLITGGGAIARRYTLASGGARRRGVVALLARGRAHIPMLGRVA